MHYYEYGKENDKTIVFLHGANFVHSFGRQYPLAEKYHLIIPHIMGYGDAADEIFDTETAVKQLADFIADIGKKVTLVGFSLGAVCGISAVFHFCDNSKSVAYQERAYALKGHGYKRKAVCVIQKQTIMRFHRIYERTAQRAKKRICCTDAECAYRNRKKLR